MREMTPIGEMAPGCEKESRNTYLILFWCPHRRDGTGCDLNDVSPRVSATAPGPRLVNAATFSWNAMLLPLPPACPDLSTVKPGYGYLRFLELSWSSFAASSSSMASPAAKGSAAEPAAGAAVAAAVAAAATLPLVSEEVA